MARQEIEGELLERFIADYLEPHPRGHRRFKYTVHDLGERYLVDPNTVSRTAIRCGIRRNAEIAPPSEEARERMRAAAFARWQNPKLAQRYRAALAVSVSQNAITGEKLEAFLRDCGAKGPGGQYLYLYKQLAYRYGISSRHVARLAKDHGLSRRREAL